MTKVLLAVFKIPKISQDIDSKADIEDDSFKIHFSKKSRITQFQCFKLVLDNFN